MGFTRSAEFLFGSRPALGRRVVAEEAEQSDLARDPV